MFESLGFRVGLTRSMQALALSLLGGSACDAEGPAQDSSADCVGKCDSLNVDIRAALPRFVPLQVKILGAPWSGSQEFLGTIFVSAGDNSDENSVTLSETVFTIELLDEDVPPQVVVEVPVDTTLAGAIDLLKVALEPHGVDVELTFQRVSHGVHQSWISLFRPGNEAPPAALRDDFELGVVADAVDTVASGERLTAETIALEDLKNFIRFGSSGLSAREVDLISVGLKTGSQSSVGGRLFRAGDRVQFVADQETSSGLVISSAQLPDEETTSILYVDDNLDVIRAVEVRTPYDGPLPDDRRITAVTARGLVDGG